MCVPDAQGERGDMRCLSQNWNPPKPYAWGISGGSLNWRWNDRSDDNRGLEQCFSLRLDLPNASEALRSAEEMFRSCIEASVLSSGGWRPGSEK